MTTRTPFYLALLPLLVAVRLAAQPAASDVYAWYAGDAGLATLADNFTVSGWTNQGTAATNTKLMIMRRYHEPSFSSETDRHCPS